MQTDPFNPLKITEADRIQEQHAAERLADLIREHSIAQRAPFYSWVRFVTTLATTLLGLSVAFQKAYVPEDPRHLWLLLFGWGLLLLSVVLGVVRSIGEFHDHRCFVDQIKSRQNKNGSRATLEEIKSKILQVGGPRVLRQSFYGMLVAFGLGIGCLVVFSCLNLGKRMPLCIVPGTNASTNVMK